MVKVLPGALPCVGRCSCCRCACAEVLSAHSQCSGVGTGQVWHWVPKLCCWRKIYLWPCRCWPVPALVPGASLGEGGMPCPRVASQLSCLMFSWLLPLTFSSQSLKPLLGQCPGPLGHLAVSGFAPWAPRSTSLPQLLPSCFFLPPIPSASSPLCCCGYYRTASPQCL